MKVLIVGNGAREHALAWKFSKDPEVSHIYAIPGNAGIAELPKTKCFPYILENLQEEIKTIKNFAKNGGINLTIVGPEKYLCAGIVNIFNENGLPIFGPSEEASQLEGSKILAKTIMQEMEIPTAPFKIFSNPKKAKTYLKRCKKGKVIKADGLAGGKGVFPYEDPIEGIEAIELIMEQNRFGDSGNKIIIEDFLQGVEASFIAATDGHTILPFASSVDHKKLYADDKGPNTGGMGAYSPAPMITKEMSNKIMDTIMYPALRGMARKGIYYQGILYAGLMIIGNTPYALEFNCRFGDPEAQPIMMRLKTDLSYIIKKAMEKNLHKVKLSWDPRPATCIVITSNGYPEKYTFVENISGLDNIEKHPDTVAFHAGTRLQNGNIVSDGGRIFSITSLGKNLTTSIVNAYAAVGEISFEGMHFRKDIGKKAILYKSYTNKGGYK